MCLKLFCMNEIFERDDLLGKNPSRKRVAEALKKPEEKVSSQETNDLFILRGESL